MTKTILISGLVALFCCLSANGQVNRQHSGPRAGASFQPPADSYYDHHTRLFYLPDARVGEYYLVKIHFQVPQDTGFGIVHIPIDSARLLALTNLPPHFQLRCDQPGCRYAGGSSGCFTVSGTPRLPDTLRIRMITEFQLLLPLWGRYRRVDTIDAGIAVVVHAPHDDSPPALMNKKMGSLHQREDIPARGSSLLAERPRFVHLPIPAAYE